VQNETLIPQDSL